MIRRSPRKQARLTPSLIRRRLSPADPTGLTAISTLLSPPLTSAYPQARQLHPPSCVISFNTALYATGDTFTHKDSRHPTDSRIAEQAQCEQNRHPVADEADQDAADDAYPEHAGKRQPVRADRQRPPNR